MPDNNYGFSLYEKGDLTKPVNTAYDQTKGAMADRARNFFGGGQGAKIRADRSAPSEDAFRHAVNTFGVNAVMNWNEQSGAVMKALRDDMRNLKQQAKAAARKNDLIRYQSYLQQSLHDKEMMAYAKMLNQARTSNAISGVLGFLSSIAGMGLGELSGQNLQEEIAAEIDRVLYETTVPNRPIYSNTFASPYGPNATNVPPGGGGYY
jgi:hypothetical protein